MAYHHNALPEGDPREGMNVLKCAAPDDNGCMVFPDHDGDTGLYTRKADWNYWVDGYPVTVQLYEYVQALRQKVNPTFKFLPFECKVLENPTLGGYLFQELCVYLKTCDFIIGKIGYGNYSIPHKKYGSGWYTKPNPDAEHKYMVYSRKITNKAVLEKHDQHNMIMSEKLDRIIPKASVNLRSYSVAEMAALSVSTFESALRKQKQAVADEVSKLINNCARYSALEVELRHLIKSGVQFITPEFREAAAKFFETDADAQGEKMRKIGAYYVRVYPSHHDAEVMRATVLTFNQDPTKSELKKFDDQVDVLLNDLPEDIQTKLSMLSMVKNNTFIPRIGGKVTSNRFWVERDL
jgi:hypothetical protein